MLAFEVTVEALDPGLVGRGAGPAEVAGDGVQGHELAGRPGDHLRPVVGHGEQDRPELVIDAEVDAAVVVTGSMTSSRPSASRAWVKASPTWMEVSSTKTTSVSHLRLARSSMMSTAIPAAVKWVVS